MQSFLMNQNYLNTTFLFLTYIIYLFILEKKLYNSFIQKITLILKNIYNLYILTKEFI